MFAVLNGCKRIGAEFWDKFSNLMNFSYYTLRIIQLQTWISEFVRKSTELWLWAKVLPHNIFGPILMFIEIFTRISYWCGKLIFLCFTYRFVILYFIIFQVSSCRTDDEYALFVWILGALILLLVISIVVFVHKKHHSKENPSIPSALKIFSQKFAFDSIINEKRNLLYNPREYHFIEQNNGSPNIYGTVDDEGYCYLSLEQSGLYEQAIRRCPIPPNESSIPSLKSDLIVKTYDSNFKIISHYPVPITEL